MTAPNIPTVADLSERIYDVITDGFDNVFREYFHGPDVVTDDWYFRIKSGLTHPMGNLLITGNQTNIGVLSDGIEPLCSDEFPSGVVCLGDVGDEADALLKTSGFQLAEEMPAMAIDVQATQGLAIHWVGSRRASKKAITAANPNWVVRLVRSAVNVALRGTTMPADCTATTPNASMAATMTRSNARGRMLRRYRPVGPLDITPGCPSSML